ncbi:M23 family metallopeptidase [Flavobacterium aquidurense]|uniref:M23 family metallopeptidase n=1 Tax=Flavobacterium aquidurense TaxID=362413 RepID=UPI00371BBFC6
MSKNAIHNFNLSIQNSADIKSSEDLTKTIIKELAKVSKEMSQQKDIVQQWQEQKKQNAAAFANNSIASTEGGAIDTKAEIKETALSIGNTPLDTEEMSNLDVSSAAISLPTTSTSSALIGGGAVDTADRTTMSSVVSDSTTPSTAGAENNTLNFRSGITTQTYASVAAQQMLTVPQTFQVNNNEPKTEVVKAEIKKRLEAAMAVNNTVETAYWRNISKAFDEGATSKDFVGKPNDMLFTQMYDMLKQFATIAVENQNINWETVREKMIEAIDANILNGTISVKNKIRWETIKKQLGDDKINVANLFEQYDELFLLLKEVEGLSALPNTITITTKTKIYPNLSADKLYALIGREDVYVFLREVNNEEIRGSAVDKGAVKIKNTTAKSFIIGESLEFFLDEKFINQNLYKKEDINWIVRNVQNKKDEGIVFVNEGTSFSYNFDTAGVYRIDAYGYKPTIKGSKNAGTSTFIELEIVAQQIEIKSPFKDSFTRASVKQQLFKVNLKNTKVKTLNPLKLYYQLETKTANKVTEISEELELDAGGIIKIALPELGEYKIKVTSKDQYALSKESKISVIKNEVTSIGYVKDASATAVFLLGDPNRKLTLEAKTFKINPPTDEEKEDVKWMIYDVNNKPYLSPGTAIMNKDKNPKKGYFHQWGFYDVPIPQKVGNYTVEAYSDIQKGSKSNSIFKIEVKQPQVTAAYWVWSGGSKKVTSGFSGESNWIKAAIPYYSNQTVRIYFYLNNKKTKHYLDVKTSEEGTIFKEIKFDSDFRKLIGFENGKNAKIGFKLLGIQNGKPCPFKVPANYDSDTLLSVTTDTKILDAYFMYDRNRVTTQDEIPFGENGAVVTIIAKTQNMVGKEIVLTAHKVGEKPTYSNAVIINSEGVAITSFILKNLNKKLKKGIKIKYYVGIEGYSTKHLTDKLLTMVMGVGTNKDNEEILDENDPQLIWGAKVSKEFRVKVVQICKRLWPKNTLEMANGLMAVMNRETGGTFAPHQIEGKKLIPKDQLTKDSFIKIDKNGNKLSRAVGLIQFTQKPLTDMGEYTGGGLDKLNEVKLRFANMTQLEQLVKIEKYMNTVAVLPTIPEEIYMAVFAPAYVGQGLDKTIYELGTTNYNENASLDVDKTKNGIQIKELIDEYYVSVEGGKFGRNIWKKPLDRMELRGWYKSGWSPNESDYLLKTTKRNKGKHLGLDLYAPIGTPVYACIDGMALILSPAYSETFGLHVRIEGYYNEKKYNFFYAHLSEIKVKNFQKVKAGTLIGYTGQTGEAEGQPARFNHLHFEVRNSRENRGAALKPLEEISDLNKNVNINPSKENQNG